MIENINWENLPNLDEYRNEDRYYNDCLPLEFTWKGQRIEAKTEIALALKTVTDEGDNDTPNDIVVEVLECEITIKKMYYRDGEDYILNAKDFIELENKLNEELTVIY